MLMRVVTYDPGETTGYAVFEIDTESGHAHLLECGQMVRWEHLEDQIRTADIVVYEGAYISSPAFNPAPFLVIGVIEFLAEKYGKQSIRQIPSTAKRAAAWGLYNLQNLPRHARDAVCHGLAYLVGAGYTKIIT